MDLNELIKPKEVLLGFTIEQRLYMIDSFFEHSGPGGLQSVQLMGKFIEEQPRHYQIIEGKYVTSPGPYQVLALLQVAFMEFRKVKPAYPDFYTGDIPE